LTLKVFTTVGTLLSMVSYFILFYLFVIDKQPCLRKHPANIMFYKCAMELLFVYPFLFIYYTDDSFSWDQDTLQCIASKSAKFFSFQSQFALLGGELYFLVVVMDLHMQCSNPFASFQHYFDQYNIIIICFSIFMAGILLTVGNKGEYLGSGTTYGLWIQDYDPDSAAIIAETSRSDDDGNDHIYFQGERSSYDLTNVALVKMFMFYGWVIGIYLYATYVITFVSMRLREGLSRTLSTRLSLARRAQKYVTGYTIYWVIVGGVDFLNYMLSGQYNHTQLEAIHVFMSFCVSGRGVVSLIIIYYTNYDDWVTSSLLYYIGLSTKFTGETENDDAINEVIKQEIAQLPHLNSTLRAEVLLFTTQGIRCVIQDYNRSKQEFFHDMSEFDNPDESGGTKDREDSMQRSRSIKSDKGVPTTATARWETKNVSTNKVASRQYVFNDFDTSDESGAARKGMISHVEQGMQDSGEVEEEIVRHKAEYGGPLLSAANLDRVDKALRRMSGNVRRGSDVGQRQSFEMMSKGSSLAKASSVDVKEHGGCEQFNPMQKSRGLKEGSEQLNSIKEMGPKDTLADASESYDEAEDGDTFNMGEVFKSAANGIDSDSSKRQSEIFRAKKQTLKKSVFILSAGDDGDDENMKVEPLAQYNAPIKEEEHRESIDRIGRSSSQGSVIGDPSYLRRATSRASVFTAKPTPSFAMNKDGDDPEDSYSFAENRDHIRSSMVAGETMYMGEENSMTCWERLARSWALCQSNMAQRRNFIFKVLSARFSPRKPPVINLVPT
jgi:hypothetical protein